MNDLERIVRNNKLFARTKDIFNDVNKEDQLNQMIDLISENKNKNLLLQGIPRSDIRDFVLELDKYNKLYTLTAEKIVLARIITFIDFDYLYNLRMLTIPKEFKESEKRHYYRMKKTYDLYKLFRLEEDVIDKYFPLDKKIIEIHEEIDRKYRTYLSILECTMDAFFKHFIFGLIVHYVDTHNEINIDEINNMVDYIINNKEKVYTDVELNGVKNIFSDIYAGNEEDEILLRYIEHFVDTFENGYKITIK